MSEIHNTIQSTLIELLNIPSPTYQEQAKNAWIQAWLQERIPDLEIREHKDSFICELPENNNKPHICLIGHTDTVPEFFTARKESGRIHGSGASDMQGALPIYMQLLHEYSKGAKSPYRLSLLIYAREERTELEENGLYGLIQEEPEFFKTIDLAIVGEPTDKSVQIGCVGSLHAKVTITGKAAHSARPWNGENALYNAHDFIGYFKKLERIKHTIFGVDFYDVMNITISSSLNSTRTIIPGAWECNVNYRYAPVCSLEQATEHLLKCCEDAGAEPENCEVVSSVYAGDVIENECFKTVVADLGLPIEAKQAWTDVAQLAQQGISAFNYGPGLTAQAHLEDEYIIEQDIYDYYDKIKACLFKGEYL